MLKEGSHRKVGGGIKCVEHAMVLCPVRDNDNLCQGRRSLSALKLRDVEGGGREKSCDFLSTYGRSDVVD